NLDFVAGHGDDGSCRGCKTENANRDLFRMSTKGIVDSHTFEEISARRVQVDEHILISDRPQRGRNALRRHAAAGPEVLTDNVEDRDRILGSLLGSYNAGVPPFDRIRIRFEGADFR